MLGRRREAASTDRCHIHGAVLKLRIAWLHQRNCAFLPSPSVDAGGSFLLRCPKRLCGCGSCALSASSHRPPRALAAGMLPPLKNGPLGSCRITVTKTEWAGTVSPPSDPPLCPRRHRHVTQKFIQKLPRSMPLWWIWNEVYILVDAKISVFNKNYS